MVLWRWRSTAEASEIAVLLIAVGERSSRSTVASGLSGALASSAAFLRGTVEGAAAVKDSSPPRFATSRRDSPVGSDLDSSRSCTRRAASSRTSGTSAAASCLTRPSPLPASAEVARALPRGCLQKAEMSTRSMRACSCHGPSALRVRCWRIARQSCAWSKRSPPAQKVASSSSVGSTRSLGTASQKEATSLSASLAAGQTSRRLGVGSASASSTEGPQGLQSWKRPLRVSPDSVGCRALLWESARPMAL
mmetsp:Transcript_29819/g.61525  ORF Transcript_29819/g.61525 Transcript_29819/m.61525 type:complete len:250 (-) Transcript_29819:35-784(-)